MPRVLVNKFGTEVENARVADQLSNNLNWKNEFPGYQLEEKKQCHDIPSSLDLDGDLN